MKYVFYILGLFSGPSFASAELDSLIKCHQALDAKSIGDTQRLSLESPTPVALVTSGRLYFLTDSSILAIKNNFKNQDIVVHLIDGKKDFYRKLSMKKDGTIGTISFEEVIDKSKAIEPTASMDKESIGLFKKDLIKRVKSMSGEYNNKYSPDQTLEALKTCEKVSSEAMMTAIRKQNTFYTRLQNAKKVPGYLSSPKGTAQ